MKSADFSRNSPLDQDVMSRRIFNKTVVDHGINVVIAGSLMAIAGCGCREHGKQETRDDDHKGKKDAHVVVNLDAVHERMRQQQNHPFHRNPSQWFRDNGSTFARGFDLSRGRVQLLEEYCVEDALQLGVREGVRIRRTPGSTILLARRDSYRRIQDTLHGFQVEGPQVEYQANAHGDCGAGIVFARDHGGAADTDQAAENEIRERVRELQGRGINARFGRRIPLSEMDRAAHEHAALMGIVCPDGRFHDWRPAGLPASFVASSHDPEEIAHGVDVMFQVANGAHGYHGMLQNFKILTLRDPEDRRLSEDIFQAAKSAAEVYANRHGINLEMIHWDAPRPA